MTTVSPIRISPLGHLLEAGDHPQRGRLPAAGRADEHHELTVLHLEVETVDGTRAVREDLADPVERHRCQCRPCPVRDRPVSVARWLAIVDNRPMVDNLLNAGLV